MILTHLLNNFVLSLRKLCSHLDPAVAGVHHVQVVPVVYSQGAGLHKP